MKPFKGTIDQWYKVDVPSYSPVYGQEHLSFVIRGRPLQHPEFSNWIQTSLIVQINADETEIETLNSRYKLGNRRMWDEALRATASYA